MTRDMILFKITSERGIFHPRCHMYFLFMLLVLIVLTGVGAILYFMWWSCEVKYLT